MDGTVTVTGEISKINFNNGTRVFGRLKGVTKDGKPFPWSVGFKANLPNARTGMKIALTGELTNDPKWGYQIDSTSCQPAMYDYISILNVLSSGFVKGVGSSLATKIVNKFGTDTPDIIANDYMRLTEVSGIKEKKAREIHESFNSFSQYFQLVNFFDGKATSHQIAAIYKKYGDKAIKKLKENPYCVIYDVDGFGFKRADELAQKAGISKDDPRRVKAGIVYTLSVIKDEGNCFCHIDALFEKVTAIIEDINVEPEVLVKKVSELVKAGILTIVDEEKLYLTDMLMCEQNVAASIRELLADKKDRFYDRHTVDSEIRFIEGMQGWELEGKQRTAVHEALNNGFSVITGGPGTGKTTVIGALIKCYLALGGFEKNIFLAAPTGKASRRMAAATGYNANTIHSMAMMAVINDIKKTEICRPLLFVVDEASMLDLTVANMFFSTVNMYKNEGYKIHVVFVGDIDQLPPIGPGNVFRNLVESPVIPTTKLVYTHRFSGAIAYNAQSVNRGSGTKSFEYDDTFKFVTCEKEESQDLVVKAYLNALTRYDIRDVQIIVPMKTRSRTASNELNEILHNIVNPAAPNKKSVTVGKAEFRVGDRVMQTKNMRSEGIANGDCGIIIDIDSFTQQVIVEMDDGNRVPYTMDMMNHLVLAYSITIHKSQGSEYKEVITSFTNEHYIMLQRNLVYTALSRAKERMVVIGQESAINQAARNTKPIIRNTELKRWLVS